MKKLLILALSIISLINICPAADDLSTLDIYDARMPMYSNGKLVMLIYSSKARRNGNEVNLEDAILDLIKRNINVDNITYIDHMKPYEFGASREIITAFWKKITHSNGLIFSPHAIVNQKLRSAYSKEKVFFRSPEADINGVGFEADFDKRTVKVLQNVIINIRQDKTSKDTSLSPGGSKGTTTITADELFIDFTSNIISVSGNVKVDEERMHIDCDKITVYLGAKEDEGSDKDGKKPDGMKTEIAADGSSRDISRIICEGNVVITRKLPAEELKLHGQQRALADRAEYDFRKGLIVLTGKRPVISRGTDTIEGKIITIWKDSERLQAEKDCKLMFIMPEGQSPKGMKRDKNVQTVVTSDFMDMNYPDNIAILTGNVYIKDPNLNIDCHKMTIYLEEKAKSSKVKTIKIEEEVKTDGTVKQLDSQKSISKIVCVGDVTIIRKLDEAKQTGEQKAMAGKAIYNLKEGKIVLSENKPIIIHGKDSINGEKVTVWIDQQRMQVDKNSRIKLNSLRDSKAGSSDLKPGTTYIDSDSSDINYGNNEMTFAGQVKVKDPQLTLDCSEMRVFLEERKDGKKKSGSAPSPLGIDSSDKDVSKVVCVGSVRARDAKTNLDCEELTLLFQDKPAGAVAGASSSFGSSKREISQIISKGDVKLVRKNDPEKQKPKTEDSSEMAALTQSPSGDVIVKSDYIDLNIVKNYAKLIGNVDVDEPRVNLKCDDMLVLASDIKPEKTPVKNVRSPEDMEFEDDAPPAVEGSAPRQISLGDKKEIDEVICNKDVIITRKALKTGTQGAQKATGDKAVYEVHKGKITMTGKNTALHQGTDVLVGKKIVLWTDSERLDIEGGKVKEFSLPNSK